MNALEEVPLGPREPTHTAQEILAAIRAWNARYGRPPSMADWEPSRSKGLGRTVREARLATGRWPTSKMVRTHFGTLNAAIAAAGLTPRMRNHRTTRRTWTDREILIAIRSWNDLYGEVPTLADWDPYRARSEGQEWRVARYQAGSWPSARTVQARFGGLSIAIERAGLRPRRKSTGRSATAPPSVVEGPRVTTLKREASHETLMARRIRAVADARRGGEVAVLRHALTELAREALAWSDELRTA